MGNGGDAATMSGRRRHFVFVSSNVTWGGSEDLWSAAAAALAGQGERVTAYKNGLEHGEPAVARLDELGCRLVELGRLPLLPKMVFALIARAVYPLAFGYQAFRLWLSLKLHRRPDLVVLSQGGNHDGWLFAQVCLRLGLPYVLICQKATDLYWPLDSRREWIRAAFAGARHVFFVSRHNLRLTQEQLGARVERASVARNPFKVAWDRAPEWPGADLGYRFACVGRLFPKEKGQDLLVRVLARDKWRSRPVSLTFYGTGEQQEGLKAMSAYHGLDNVRFAGFAVDIEAVWANHHALVLPSRAEGLPLVLVEAMLCGRVAIVTDVAGNAEAVDDGITGFVAAAATEDSLDEAMERAWQRRGEWPEIGRRAASAIRERVPPDPAGELAAMLQRIAGGEALPADRSPSLESPAAAE